MKPKIIYTCSYIPDQELSRYGYDLVSIHEVNGAGKTDHRISGNICSFLKKICAFDYSGYDGIIMTNCCNSAQRVYDYLKYRYPSKFIYLLELPREQIMNTHLNPLRKALHEYFHKPDQYSCPGFSKIGSGADPADILVISSSLHKDYICKLKEVFPACRLKAETCYGLHRGDRILNGEFVSCPRMFDYGAYIMQETEKVKAVIFITIANCDPCIFSQPFVRSICRELGKKFLFIEEEYSNDISERSRIRYEAFLETLNIGNEMSYE